MKKNAIISTLLDRQILILNPLLNETSFDLITPKLFTSTHKAIAKSHDVKCITIENTFSTEEEALIKEEAELKNTLLDKNKPKLDKFLKENNYQSSFSDYIIESAKKRTEKIITLYKGLDKLKEEYNIKALLTNQEYLIHEATLVQWAKYNNIPSIHLCHSPYVARNLGSIRQFIADHLTLTTSRCIDTLDDMETGKGQKHITGLVNWDSYRTIELNNIIDLKTKLTIPDEALVVSFFTTYAVHENATSDPLTYEKTLDAFMEAAAKINEESERSVFFIIKDRPSGVSFSNQRANHLAKKLGLENNFAYIFDRPESVILISDITVSPGSSIAVESMAMGCATIELVSRQVFLGGLIYAANDGVAQCEAKDLYSTLSELIYDEDKRESLTNLSSNNNKYVYPTIELSATKKATAKILEIIGEKELSDKVLDNDSFYDNLNTQGYDHRFYINDKFKIWRTSTQPNELTGQLMGERYNAWKNQPTFHLLLVVDESLFNALATTLDSFELQIYKHYGITILSTAPCPIEDLSKQENIQWIQAATPFEAINQAIEDIDADWIMQLWPGDELHPQALFNLADYADLNPDWLAIYGDEVLVKLSDKKLDNDESRLGTSLPEDPAFKPDFNLDLLRSTDYVNRCVAFRKDAWQALGGYQAYAYRQNEDLIFRLAERMTIPAIGHVPYILVNRSPYTDQLIDSNNYEKLGSEIRLQHLVRCGYNQANVNAGLYQGVYNIQYNLPDLTVKADLLVATPALDTNLANFIRSYLKSNATNQTLLYLAIPTDTVDFTAWLIEEKLTFKDHQPKLVPLHSWQGELAAWRELISASESELVIFALNRLRFVQPTWIDALLDQLQRPDIAMAAPRLVSTNASILSAGQILGKNGLVGDLYENFFLEQEVTGLPRAWCEQNFNALNPACLAVKRSKLMEQGGFSSDFTSLLAVNDLQIKLCLAGNKLVWTPLSSVVLVGSNNYQLMPEDKQLFKKNWFALLTHDPAFNPNLALRGSGLDADDLLAGKWHHQHRQRPRVLTLISDPNPEQIHLGQSLTKIFVSNELKEQVQVQNYSHLSAANAAVVNSIELARLQPDLCIYSGKPEAFTNTIEDLAGNTTIQQWVLVSNEADFQHWKKMETHLTGYLIADMKLFQSLSCEVNIRLVLDSNTEEICSKRLVAWVEEVFN
ncbi:hypothetical protein [Marinospirillum insulare]|uniref:Uncharacterized protein n=1 Tax=Marinospirillum insulare TaxID=217169 RepID=A0ABQ5ZVH8_9GAMM|nr:hypothetical protein [Marinospirillum insulare]GLR63042.1 hypothetical protein GCM10007878_04770 [Marinospirillum insulare]